MRQYGENGAHTQWERQNLQMSTVTYVTTKLLRGYRKFIWFMKDRSMLNDYLSERLVCNMVEVKVGHRSGL